MSRDIGIATLAQLIGEDRAVAFAAADESALDSRLREAVVGFGYGQVWADERLGIGERQLITVALLTAAGRQRELATHLRAARARGVEAEVLAEVIVHTALYAGFPAALDAMATLSKVLEDA